MAETLESLVESLGNGVELTGAEIGTAAEALLDGGIAPEGKAAFLRALAGKGESPGEIAGFVNAFLEHAVPVPVTAADLDGPMIDVCGTGGDKLDLFNVSTTSIFILAGGGAKVVKHGNRGITSKSGGADVLERLGVRIDLPPEDFVECVKRHGAGFLFAQQYHPAFKEVAPVRAILAEEGQRTVFNILGPLLNPARPDFQLIGVFDPELPPVFTEILDRLGRRAAWAVHGQTADGGGVDELSTMGPTRICRVAGGVFSEEQCDAGDLGLASPQLAELQGGDGEENAGILEGVLDGSLRGAKRDMAALNAAAGFAITGLADDLGGGLAMAEEVLESGKALRVLRALQEVG